MVVVPHVKCDLCVKPSMNQVDNYGELRVLVYDERLPHVISTFKRLSTVHGISLSMCLTVTEAGYSYSYEHEFLSQSRG